MEQLKDLIHIIILSILESNLRLVDCINKVLALIERAIELGLCGLAITDHECLSAHVEANQYAQKIAKEHPDFKIALGNEIYLCPNRDKGQKYYHFILIAKNAQGHKALRELSSRAWMNSFVDRRMERVVTTYDDLIEICSKYPNSLIASTACLAGELSAQTLLLIEAEKLGDKMGAENAHNDIVNFILFCQRIFGEDFYIECAPGCSKEQIAVNRRLLSISKCFKVPMIIGSDSHYLKKEDRYIHKAFLNSKEGEREVDAFYEYSYLQSNEEIIEHLQKSSYDELYVNEMFKNSQEIYNKIENYSLFHTQQIPKVEIQNYPKQKSPLASEYSVLNSLFESDDKINRFWVNQCFEGFKKKNIDWKKQENKKYLDRLEEEATTKQIIGEKLNTNMFSYPVTLQYYMNLIWECGSPVGAGRGSSCAGLNHWLLEITQLNPLEWNFPWFRYLNTERAELGDIDIDVASGKRPEIIRRIKQDRRKYIKNNFDEQTKDNLGCTLVATFKKETTKSTVLTSCRGYRSQDCPNGIDIDIAQYLSSLVPAERGEVWSLSDVLYGNEEKRRKPIQLFINEVNQYNGLIDIMFGINELISGRSSHASGVILFDKDPYEHCAFMRTPKGEIITQWDLHQVEFMGNTKYDVLITKIQDKIINCIRLLQQDGLIEKNLSLKEIYDKYLHPNVLPLDDEKVWDAIDDNKVLDLFQFDSEVGIQAANKIRPRTMQQLSISNGLMRLTASEKGGETPMEKYIRYKNNIQLWYDEMKKYGLTKEEMDIVSPYFAPSFGVPIAQEDLMRMLMDSNICGFSLGDANTARKIVAKKQTKRVTELQQKIYATASSPALGRYIWNCGVKPQASYSFSEIHSTAYSFIGFQTSYLATHWNPIYWNTACLIVNSESEEDEEIEDNDEDIKRNKQSDYGKIAKAIGAILTRGIKISLVDINRSSYSFKPDAKNNQILYGMKALTQVNDDHIKQIIAGRPYVSFKDFLNRCPLKKPTMISLIKAGAFDTLEEQWARELNIEPRILIMVYYILSISEPKSRLTLQNFNGLIQNNLIPKSMDLYKQIFNFNKYLRANKKAGLYLILDENCTAFYSQYFDIDKLQVINGSTCILFKDWEKIYSASMDAARDWLKDNQQTILNEYNTKLFLQCWEKYAAGNISYWEMSALCFYYHPHELINVNKEKYGIANFHNLSSKPLVDYYFKRNGRQIPVYKIYRIAGTVIGKNDTRASISLLTTEGVVNVKFTKEYYAMFKKQISEKQDDGTRSVKEKGWFTRGTKLMVQGFRRDDTFIAKTYSHTVGHTLYKITNVEGENIELTHERYDEGENN